MGSILPEANSRAIFQANHRASNATAISACLVRVASDGSLTYSSEAMEQNINLTFTPLTVTPGQATGLQTAPSLANATFYNNQLWGYDSSNVVYVFTPTFSAGTYALYF